MMNVKDYIESGIIESYVIGVATADEEREVMEMAAAYHEVRAAINEFSVAMESYALAHAVAPDPTIKPFLMATIDYTDRLEKGEPVTFPPVLHESSQIADYAEWLNRSDMVLPEDFKDFHAKIIGYTPQVTTAIVWIKYMAPQEVHEDEFEKFLVIEGTCDITIGENVHKLAAGDYLAIPLHQDHNVRVTSAIPCKVILQRVAA